MLKRSIRAADDEVAVDDIQENEEEVTEEIGGDAEEGGAEISSSDQESNDDIDSEEMKIFDVSSVLTNDQVTVSIGEYVDAVYNVDNNSPDK